MTADFALWNALVSTATLVVVAVAAIAAFRQIRQLRAQTSLAGFLKILEDWRDPDFKRDLEYVRGQLPAKMREPGFLEEYDSRPVDRAKHPELNVCDWYEQLGSYLKYGLLDEDVMLDVSATSCNTMWKNLEPAIERMRRTRGDALYENFEYLAVRGVLHQRAHPNGTYPRNTPRMAQIGGSMEYGQPSRPANDAAAAAGAPPATA
jgi:Domain of unknown function (DUF4760)